MQYEQDTQKSAEKITTIESKKTIAVRINIETANKMKKAKGLFEDVVNSSKEKEIIDYIANLAIERYFKSDEFKKLFNESF